MKCKKCGKPAEIALPEHNTAYCAEDFIRFFQSRVERTVDRYRLFPKDGKVCVAVSGGKDSLALLHVLKKLGYRTHGIYVNLGIPEYSNISAEKCAAFSAEFDIPIESFSVERFFGKPVRKLAHIARREPCSICGVVKRYVMNRFAFEGKFDCLATGHNLDDESSSLLGNLMNFDKRRLGKAKLMLPAGPTMAKKVKPLTFIAERESAAYALMNGIDYIMDECPFAKGATSMTYKASLSLIEEGSPGTKHRFLGRFMENADMFSGDDAGTGDDDRYCTSCGALSWNELCPFCALSSKASPEIDVRGGFAGAITLLKV